MDNMSLYSARVWDAKWCLRYQLGDRFQRSDRMLGVGNEDSHFVASWWLNEVKVVSAWRQVFELAIEEEDLLRLRAIARSRTEPASRVERAQMLLAYRDNS